MTTRERKEARLERRREWAGKAHSASDAAYSRAHHALDGIEPGQPILVGHHSEGKHRAAIRRHDNAMDKCLERDRMATRHERAADGLSYQLAHTIFSDDDGALELLREKIRDLEAQAERIKALNVLIRREMKAGLPAGWLDRIGATEGERNEILHNAKFDWRHEPMFPGYVLTNLRSRIKAAQERIKDLEGRAQRQEIAAASQDGVTVERFGEWCRVTFAEKPARGVLSALRSAGYRWGGGSWQGRTDALPGCVTAVPTAMEIASAGGPF